MKGLIYKVHYSASALQGTELQLHSNNYGMQARLHVTAAG